MSEFDQRPPPPAGVPGLAAPPSGWPGGGTHGGPPPPSWPDGAGPAPVIAVPIAPPGGSGRPTVLIVSIVIVIVLVWTAPVYFYWWKPRHGLGTIAMSQIRSGDCIDFADRGNPSRDRGMFVLRVKCAGPHYFEVTEVLDLGIRNTLVPETCAAAFERYVGIAPEESTAWDSEAHPELAADGSILEDRTFCVIYGTGGPATSSARGTKR